MGFRLKAQKYDLQHLLGMPFACEPLCTVGVVAQKVLTGVVNVLWVLVEAEFIDRGIKLVTGGETLTGMIPFLTAMLLIVAWKRMGYSFGRIMTRRIEVSAVYQMSVEEKLVSFRELEQKIFAYVCELGREITQILLESYDKELAEGRDKKTYRGKGSHCTSIKAVYGEVAYSSTADGYTEQRQRTARPPMCFC